MSATYHQRRSYTRSPGSRLTRWLLGLLLVLAGLVVVLYLVARFLVWPNVDTIVARYAGALEARLGTSLTWQSLHPEWTGLRPSIEIVAPVLGSGSEATRADRIFATISLQSLLRGQAGLHDLVLDKPMVRLRRSGDSLSLAALGGPVGKPGQSSGVAQWLLQQPDMRIGGGTLVIVDDTDPRRSLRLDQVALVVRSSGRSHGVRLDIADGNALAASLVLQADLVRKGSADPVDWRTWAGKLQLEGRQVSAQSLLAQLPAPAWEAVRTRLSGIVPASLAGQFDPSISLDLDYGEIADARLRLRSDDLSLVLAGSPNLSGTANPLGTPGTAGTPRGSLPASGSGTLRFSRVNADLRLRQGPAGATDISASVLELAEVGGARLRATTPMPTVTLAPGGGIERLAGGFERLDIEPVLGLARLVAPEPAANSVAAMVHRLSGSGELNDVEIAWDRAVADEPPRWRVRAAFERASLAIAPTEEQVRNPWKIRIPDLHNLAGSFEATEAGGKGVLRTPPVGAAAGQGVAAGADGTPAGTSAAPAGGPAAAARQPSTMIRFVGALVEPEVPFLSLDSQFSWKVDRRAGPGWLAVLVERLIFVNGDGSVSATGRYQTGGRGAGILDLRARVGSLQVNRVWRYLPHEVPEKVRGWIREAFESGLLEGGEARWRGDIRDFPYRLNTPQEQGEFRFSARARDVLFKYAPDWPALHGLGGEVVFDRASLNAQVERATLQEVALSGVTARMEDVAGGKVEVEGRGQGDVSHMLKFINASPLVNTLGGVTRPMVARGPGTLELKLGLALRDMPASTARGRLDVAGGALQYESAHVKLEDVNGRIEFTDKSLTFSRVRAGLSGMPIDLSGQTGEPGTMRMQARGTLTVEGVRQLAGEQWSRHLSGSAPFSADVDIGRDGTRLTIESSLAGLASNLPAPLAKAGEASWPLKLTVAPGPAPAAARPGAPGSIAGAASDRLEASLGGEVQVVAERSRSDARRPMQIRRAVMAVNRQPTLPDQGLSFHFTGQRIDLDAWKQLLTATPARSDGAGIAGGDIGTLPLTVSLVAEELRVADRNLSKVVVGATRTGAQWQANVSAREVNGFLTWNDSPGTDGKLTARLGRLEIPLSQQQEIATSLSSGPLTLPAMDITADRFILNGLEFGALELVARNTVKPGPQPSGGRSANPGANRPRVWQLERLRLTNPSAQLEANGVWDRATSLSYRLNLSDAGGFLNRLEVKDAVKGGKGSISGDLHWNGSPFSMDLNSLGGTADIAVRDGQFLKVEPGAAKLIGVLNLQALPKLLTLDFRDIFAQGFSFGDLRGRVVILDGVASTDSLAMRGLQAVVQIKGQADLRTSTQDLRVVVVPELNGGLATLAFAAIVNPAIGLGAFFAQSLFSQPLSRAFAYEIDVTGPWADPTVVERKRERFGPPVGQ